MTITSEKNNFRSETKNESSEYPKYHKNKKINNLINAIINLNIEEDQNIKLAKILSKALKSGTKKKKSKQLYVD